MDTRIESEQIRTEKHPGKDDVNLLELADGTAMQVDGHVFHSVKKGATLRKTAWSAEFKHDGSAVDLTWSKDFVGLTKVMPAAFVVILGALAASWWLHRHDDSSLE